MTISSLPIPADLGRTAAHVTEEPPSIPLICFSHLTWGFVWQRPQHLLTRLSQDHPVFYVEQPEIHTRYPSPELTVSHHDGVTILSPTLPARQYPDEGYGHSNNAALRNLLETYFYRELGTTDVVAWYYTPLAYGALPQALRTVATVFDEMDDTPNVRGLSKEMREQDQLLMRAADLVFCAGPSLQESRKYRHRRVFSFPSGVDVDHFRRSDLLLPPDIAKLPSPVIGYYGVVDERIDFNLIAEVAHLRPDWSIAILGPVARIFEKSLADRPNIYYMGPRRYSDLPAYLAAFDVAMLPYALNKRTRSITPAKTLEYLAGGKPVVSTPMTDVVDLYGDVVQIARSGQEFVKVIEDFLSEPSRERASREGFVQAVLREYDWEVIANRMKLLIHDVINGRPTLAAMLRNTATSTSPLYTATISRSRR